MTIRKTSGNNWNHNKNPNTNMLLCFSNILLGRICTAIKKKKRFDCFRSNVSRYRQHNIAGGTGRKDHWKIMTETKLQEMCSTWHAAVSTTNVVVRRAHLAPSQWPPSNATDKKVRHTQRPIPPLLHRSSGLPLPTLLLGNIPDSSVPYIQRPRGFSVHIRFSVRQAVNSH